MEKTTELLCTPVERAGAGTDLQACLVHIYPTGPDLGRRYPLAEAPLLIGRGNDCAIRIEDHSVSRRHARIELRGDGPYAVDLDSTNGTFVNDRRAPVHRLKDGDYLRTGNAIYRFLAGGNIEAEYHEEIHRMAIIDALTDIPNKRYLIEFLERELARTVRYTRPLSLILFDIDHFKAVNDSRGHLCGDYTLRELAGTLKTVVRQDELLARYGGEEFAVVLPETAQEQALVVGQRLRTLVEEHSFSFDGKLFRISISLGLVTTIGADAYRPEDLVRLADEKLYEAKRTGRNRLVA